MTSYPTKYLFIAETQGVTQAAAELNKLKSAMQGMQASPINLSRAQQAQSNAAAAAARAAQAQANAQNAANRAQAAGIRTAQQQATANTQAAISIQKVAQAQSNAAAAAARAQAAQARATKVMQGSGDPSYLDRFFNRFRSAFAYTVAFAAIGTAFAAIGGSVRAWIDAQIQLNDVVADSIILLGRTAQEGERFANIQRELAFATGQPLQEVAPSSMMAERVGQPELAVSAAQWSMVVGPQLQASETVDDLRALSIQFGLSTGDINDSLLATLQNSGIVADQLFDLSASFGVFAGQLGLGETERDLREISGLFAALSNITGQTTPTLQNFVRRMADEFYDPNAALRQQLNAAGIQTVTQGPVTTTYDIFGNATRTSEEIRRPFTEIFAEIAQKGPAAIKQFSTAIDNSLGQPTQSQFILVAENWERVDSIIGDIVASSANFAEAAQTAAGKLQVSLDRIGVSFTNMLSVLGDEGLLRASLDTISSTFQNTYDALRDPSEGMRKLGRDEQVGRAQFGVGVNEFGMVNRELANLERQLDRAYGGQTEFLTRRLHEILRVIEVPEQLSPDQAKMFSQNAVQQFMASDYLRPGDNSTTGAQQFQRFYSSNEFSMVSALRAAYPGVSDADLLARFDGILSEMERRVSRGFSPMPGLVTQAPGGSPWPFSTGPLPSPYMSQGTGLRNMMLGPDLMKTMGPVWNFPSVSLPEDVTPAGFDKAYDEVSAILTDRFGPAIGEAEVEVIAFRDSASGLTVALGAYNEHVAQETIKYLQASGRTEKASGATTTAFYTLAGAALEASGALGSILSRAKITLSDGMTYDEWKNKYRETERILADTYGGTANLSTEEPRPYIFIDETTGMPLREGGDLNPDIVEFTNARIAAEQAASAKSLAEQKSYQSKALAAQEAYQNKMLGAWNGMVSDLLKPSSVTGTDLFYNSPRGTYNDNWDEPVRRMKADINNALAGKPLEYGYGGLTPYMNMDAVAMAMGATQEVKEAILRSEEARVSEQFYNMELPWEAYSGNTDAIVANAQAWIARKQQKNANMANVQQLLVDAGLGPDAEAFVKAMEEPPILRAVFGGKSAEEINTTVTEAVTPDMTTALARQASETSWSLTIATAIQNDVTNNYEVIVAAGKVIGEGLAKGSASQFAAAIIPLVLAAISGRE